MEHSKEQLLLRLRREMASTRHAVPTPFGYKPLVYADYTASGRPLDSLEEVMRESVLPFYANTHSESAFTGMQTGRFREGARAAVRRSVGADERHAVIFSGNGATGAIAKFQGAFGDIDPAQVAVFVGPYEHHSNDLPWREWGASIVRIPLDGTGRPCLATLAEKLQEHRGKALRIGAFSAASNVTGVRTDMRELAKVLHAHDAICMADYAAAAPYIDIEMGESAPGANDHCDAIVFSPHKFVGGPGASGVLVVDRMLFARNRPVVPGGGSVSYVTQDRHRYVGDIERREEAGTPNIIGDIRAGLVCDLKAAIGTDIIAQSEHEARSRALAAWSRISEIDILGPRDADCLAIFSLVIRHGDKVLHPGLVVAALNDIFGIQARAGCSCAGPYAHSLLGIDDARSRRYEALIESGYPLFRPGWTRLGFHVLHDAQTVDYIIDAVSLIARSGARLLSLYTANPRTGRWQSRLGAPVRDVPYSQLSAALFEDRRGGEMQRDGKPAQSFSDCIAQAEALLAGTDDAPAAEPLELPGEPDDRWFAL